MSSPTRLTLSLSLFIIIRDQLIKTSMYHLLHTVCCSEARALRLGCWEHIILRITDLIQQATVSSFYVFVLYTAMLRTSIAAAVLGCFYVCPLDCDASVMVVDCAAVETGCMLEKYIKVATKYVFIIIFWSRCCCGCCVLLLPTTSVLKLREVPATVSSFSVSATTTAVPLRLLRSIILLLLLLRRDACRKKTNKKCYFFFFGGCAAAALHKSRAMC